MIYQQIWVEENINPKAISQEELCRLWYDARHKGLAVDSSNTYQLLVDDSDCVSVIRVEDDIDYCFRFHGFMFYNDNQQWQVIQ